MKLRLSAPKVYKGKVNTINLTAKACNISTTYKIPPCPRPSTISTEFSSYHDFPFYRRGMQ
jgi:hypothetical protein